MTFHIIGLTILLTLTPWASLEGIAIISNFTYLFDLVLIQVLWARKNRQDGIKLRPMLEGAFEDWGQYLTYGVPSAIMLCSEFWIFEVITVMAGYLSSVELATVVVITSLYSALYEISAGLGFSITSIVG